MDLLAKVQSEAWVGLLGVLIGASLSILGVWLTNRSSVTQLRIQLEHEKKIRDETIRREKLEELYVLLGNWLSVIFGHYLRLSLVMQNKIDYNEYLDQFIKSGKDSLVDYHRLEMIVDIYAHELKPSWEKILAARDELNKVSAAHKRAYKTGNTDGERYLQPYTDAQLKIDELTESFKKEIAEHVKHT